jgi:hypothetical protein
MQTITCDGCGAPIEIGYGHPKLEPLTFSITAKDGRIYQFGLEETKLIWQFNTTNVHFCRQCLVTAFHRGLFGEYGKTHL